MTLSDQPESRSVEWPHYHVWTDALHGRALARGAKNRWDRGTYVRWSIASAWSAFENVVGELVDDPAIGYRFRARFDAALEVLGVSVDWGKAPWQSVSVVQERRKDYVHLRTDQEALFPDAAEAERAILALRSAVLDLAAQLGQPAPEWILDDTDYRQPSGSRANLTVVRAGAHRSAPDVIRVTFVDYEGAEFESEVLPAGSAYEPAMAELLRTVTIPIRAVRAYRGGELVAERFVRMRGS